MKVVQLDKEIGKNIECKVNLIPFNQISGIYKRSDNDTINNFIMS